MTVESSARKRARQGNPSVPEFVLGGAAAGLAGVIKLIFKGIGMLFSLLGSVIRAHRIVGVLLAVALVAVVGGVADFAVNAGKVYPGVSIGSVNVSGMTRDEAVAAVDAAYGGRVTGNEAIVFADEETAASADLDEQLVQDDALAEQISFEEAQRTKKLWAETAETLGASLPTGELVDEALAVGRTGAGLFDRIAAFASGRTIDVRVSFSDEQVELLASDIDSAIGEERVDYDIAIDEEGQASVVEGHDGWMVNRDWLKGQLAGILLGDAPEGSFVAQTEYAPLRIDQAAAQAACDAANALIASGAQFTYDGRDLTVERAELGSWISTRLGDRGGSAFLDLYIDNEKATPSLVALMNEGAAGSNVAIHFNVDGDNVTVTPEGEITVPLIANSLSTLDGQLFGGYRADGSSTADLSAVPINTETRSDTMSFDDAYNAGVITEISSFTTQYVDSDSTQNRKHNIHHVADLLNNSVAAANGGEWSYNDTAGNFGEAEGFLPAGSISDGEYTDSYGGGVCQVATTVFNAVYDAGYPVLERRNHSLYIASYPAGRDAAVSYPDLDLVWQNDTASDVLLRTSYTDTTVTVTLYGVDPNYIVTTDTGDWEPGEKYKTKTVVDDTLEPGTSYTKTAGTNGMKIEVTRTVKTQDGDVVRQDLFQSVYNPVNELIVKGPDAPAGDGGGDSADDDAD